MLFFQLFLYKRYKMQVPQQRAGYHLVSNIATTKRGICQVFTRRHTTNRTVFPKYFVFEINPNAKKYSDATGQTEHPILDRTMWSAGA
jgi:hypothetical protein